MDIWDLIITHLTPKSVLSPKPLSIKSQKAILLFESNANQDIPSLMPAIKIMLIVLLQQNRLVELYRDSSATIILTADEEEIKKLFIAQYDFMASINSQNQLNSLLIAEFINRIYHSLHIKAC